MQHLVGGVSSAGRALPAFNGEEFRVTKAKGAYLWDANGNRFVDTALGFGAVVVGHADDEINERVLAAVGRGSMPAFAHDLEEEAAASLVKRTGALKKAVFVNTGSEAVHLACRVARAVTGRKTIAKAAAGYDGWYDDVAYGNVSSAAAAMSSNLRPTRYNTTLFRYNDHHDIELLFEENKDIAAILIEPMLANSGCILAQPGYLEHVAKVARANGALVIMDEVLMGFRLHAGLSSHLMGIEPDLATVGKAIGNGFVVAATLGRPEIMECLDGRGAVRAGTYNGNPVATAAVAATMARLDQIDYGAMTKNGDRVREAAEAAFAERGTTICSSGYGTVFTFWAGNRPPQNYADAAAIVDPAFTLSMHYGLRAASAITMPLPFGRHYISHAHLGEATEMLIEAFKQAAKHSVASQKKMATGT